MRVSCACGKNFIELPDDAKVAADARVMCRACSAAAPQRDTTTYPYAFDHDLPRTGHCMIEREQDDAEPTDAEPTAHSEGDSEAAKPEETSPGEWMSDANAIGVTTNTQTGREWIPDGFNVKKLRRVRKPVPAIANDGSLTGKRKVIAYLHWNLQWPPREIADELGMKPNAVKCVIRRLRSREAARSETEQRKRQRIAVKRKARKLFRMGATVRVVAAELKISVGKAQALKPAA